MKCAAHSLILSLTLSLAAQLAATEYDAAPYLQNLTQTSVVVRWYSTSAYVGAVEYTASGAGAWTRVSESSAKNYHEIPITGLSVGARYDYRCQNGSTLISTYSGSFKTAPASTATTFSFNVLADSQDNQAPAEAVGRMMVNYPSDLLAMCGDTNASAYKSYTREFFNPYNIAGYLRNTPLFAVPGNHEVKNETPALAKWQAFMTNPGNNNDKFFAFSYGNARFVMLNSVDELPANAVGQDPAVWDGTTADGPQRTWLEAEMASAAFQNATWRFLFLHHPPSSVSADFENLIKTHKVDVVFHGHNHQYKRYWAETSANHTVHYICSGGGGGTQGGTEYSFSGLSSTSFITYQYHFMACSVNGSTLAIQGINKNGAIIDTVEIKRTSSGVIDPPTFSVAPSASNITAVAARINWSTNEVADAQVEFGRASSATSYGQYAPMSTTPMTDTAGTLNHNVDLTGLTGSSWYWYRAKSRDLSGNLRTSRVYTFQTTAGVAAPVINSPGAASGTVGQALGYTITATNAPTSFGASGLPAGLSVNPSTGVISGTPSVAGTFNVTISASNAGGTDTAPLTITLASAASLPAPWRNVAVGSAAGSATYASSTFSLIAGGTDIWDTADSFHYVYQPWSGDGTIVARVDSFTTPGTTFSLAAVMFRQTLQPDSVHASMMVTNAGKAKFRRRSSVGATTLSDGPAGDGTNPIPRWLKLVRQGNNFSAYTSGDGSNWNQIHSTQAVTMPASLYVGFIALRNDGAGTCTAKFSNVSVGLPNGLPVISSATADPASATVGQSISFTAAGTDPDDDSLSYAWNFGDGTPGSGSSTTHSYAAPGSYTATVTASDGRGGSDSASVIVVVSSISWTDSDVGTCGVGGSSTQAGGVFILRASGTDVYGAADAFHYVYQQLTGDGSIVARVTAIQNSAEWAQAGVMIRSSLAANSIHATMMVTQADRAKFRYRAILGGSTVSNGYGPGSGLTLPRYVRLQRVGSTLTGSISGDGVSWEVIGTKVLSMTATVYVGFYACSANNAVLGGGTLDCISTSGSMAASRELGGEAASEAIDLGVFSLADKDKLSTNLALPVGLSVARGVKIYAQGLPKGLRVSRGKLGGWIRAKGEQRFEISVAGKNGKAVQQYRIRVVD